MDNEYCIVPLSGHISIDAAGKLISEYKYSTISARSLADLLLSGLGADAEELFTGEDNDSTV